MKKSAFAILCASALCLSLLAGCAGKSPETSPAPEESPAAGAENDTETGVKPENISNTGETKSLDVAVQGQTLPTEMTRYIITLEENVPVEIYVDAQSYNVAAFDSDYKLCPSSDCNEPDSYVSLSFVAGKTTDEVAEAALGGRRDGSTVSDEGAAKIGENDARHILFTGKDYEYYENVYYIETQYGTICAAIHLGGEGFEGFTPYFEAMLNTLCVLQKQG